MSTEVKPTDWDAEDNRWEPTPSGGGGGSSLPSYSSADIGKVLTVGEGSETVQTVIVPEQTVTLADTPVAVSGADASAFVVGKTARLIADSGKVKDDRVVTCVEAEGIIAFATQGAPIGFAILNGSVMAVGAEGTWTVSLTASTPKVEPKWAGVGLPDWTDAPDGSILTITNGAPHWASQGNNM